MQGSLQEFFCRGREYAVIVLDLQGTIVEWLGAAQELLGYTSQEMVGRKVGEIFIAPDREKGFDEFEMDVARVRGRSEDDRWHTRKDGTRVWITGSIEPLLDAREQVVGYVKVLRDRTDLRIQIETLESRLHSCTTALERTHAFLRTLGHEMRNPLAPLQNAAAILERTNDDPRADKAIAIISAQIQVLTRLASDLMDVSRLDAGAVKLAVERHDLRQLLRETYEGFKQTAEDKGLTLILVLPKGPLWVDVDKAKFNQAASNLLSNAVKYTPSGKVWIKATQEATEVLLRIEDTGMGIRPDLLPRLFDLFSRGESAAESAPGGMGVGLAVVRQLVELHGGSVQARSAGVGKGSEFTVRLPAADRQGQDID